MYKTEKEKVKYLLDNIEPVDRIFPMTETLYRAAAKLIDGTIIPCVEFKPYTPKVIRCFTFHNDEAKEDKETLVDVLFIGRNSISPHCVEEVMDSPYVIPKQFRGKLLEFADTFNINLVHSGFHFVTQMDDGTEFVHYYVENSEFIDLPDGYTSKQIINVIPKIIGSKRKRNIKPLGNRISFDCYLKGL
jgi:hypothetical protein